MHIEIKQKLAEDTNETLQKVILEIPLSVKPF